jgi:hypothetical protein
MLDSFEHQQPGRGVTRRRSRTRRVALPDVWAVRGDDGPIVQVPGLVLVTEPSVPDP